MVGRMPENLRAGLREMLIAIGTQDAPRLVQSYRTLDVLLPGADVARIEMVSTQVFDRFWGKSMAELRKIGPAELMQFGLQFRELLLEMPFQLPENLLLLGRTVAMLSGMCTGLDPEFNVWASIAPYATELIADEGGSNWQMWLSEAGRILQVMIGLPSRMDRVPDDDGARRTERAHHRCSSFVSDASSNRSIAWLARSPSLDCSSPERSCTPPTSGLPSG